MKLSDSLRNYTSILKELLLPSSLCDTILEIPYDQLYESGYRYMLFDVDNTLMSRDEKLLTLEFQNWVEKVKDFGFTVLLVSNNSSYRRIKRVANQLRVKGIHFALKPFPFSTRDLMREHYIDSEKCVFVGDQILTDVLMGNWLKMHTVLVDPIGKKLSFFKTLQREVELYIFEKLSKQ